MATKKKTNRGSYGVGLFVPVASVLVLLFTLFGVSSFLRIVEIDVSGISLYTADEIIEASGISVGDNMLFLGRGKAEDTIKESKPYISEVRIVLALPDRITIAITESTALATVKYMGGVLLIDSAGRELERVDYEPEGLIELRGITPVGSEPGARLKIAADDETRLSFAVEVLTAIEDAGIQKDVHYLDVTSIANIAFGYTWRYRVLIGGPNNVAYKLSRLSATIDSIVRDDRTGTLNMSESSEPGKWFWLPD
jgi:cell division protein FtsQ